MPAEPSVKRVHAFFDGQNLFYAAKNAFGYSWPNYDPLLLSRSVCQTMAWQFDKAWFYTGVPSPQDDPQKNHFWTAKLAQMGRVGVQTFSRHLKYRNQTVLLPEGGTTTVLVGNEKGVDVRLALDVVAAVRDNLCDVALIFSQDQDLLGSRGRGACDLAATESLDQTRLCIPRQPHLFKHSRDQQLRLDSNRPQDL